jgi:hypothetical protein
VSAAVASIDIIQEGFEVTSLQEYAIARANNLAAGSTQSYATRS